MSEAKHTLRERLARAIFNASLKSVGRTVLWDDGDQGWPSESVRDEARACADAALEACGHVDLANASHSKDYTLTTLRLQRADLIKAGAAFYAAYEKLGDDIPDSDLDDAQPKHITVTLGDIRRMRRALARATPQKEHA